MNIFMKKQRTQLSQITRYGFMLAAFGASTLAFAGNDSGFYIGGSLGSADIKYSYNNDSFDDDDTAYKVFGGYNFGIVPFLDIAAEVSVIDFGSADINTGDASADLSAVTAAGIVGFNLGPVGLFGKAGVVDWDSDLRISDVNNSDSGTDPFYGLGAKVQFGAIGVRAEYERFDIDTFDLNLYTLGVSYTF